MKHHKYSPGFQFVKVPIEFNKYTPKNLLQYCLGGVLYMPGTKRIIDKILEKNSPAPSMVMCFEDAIQETDLPDAEENVLDHLDQIAQAQERGDLPEEEIPLLFLRVRNLKQFKSFSSRLNQSKAKVLSGFVFPKFFSGNALEYLDQLASVNNKLGVHLFGMPILENRSIVFLETRYSELARLKENINPYKEMILNIRIGGTDFSSLFAVRRDINTSIYNIMVVNHCLSDILNFFGRHEDGYAVSAPVWEYFLAYKQEDLDRLLSQSDRHPLMRRNIILNEAVDGLLREVIMDKANGFIGKTIIHPSHLRFVNGMLAVTQEEHEDAQQILGLSSGVVKSARENKMNEINPHRSWARKIAKRAEAFGVIKDENSYLRLILGGS